jgi:hypothetical protein
LKPARKLSEKYFPLPWWEGRKGRGHPHTYPPPSRGRSLRLNDGLPGLERTSSLVFRKAGQAAQETRALRRGEGDLSLAWKSRTAWMYSAGRSSYVLWPQLGSTMSSP